MESDLAKVKVNLKRMLDDRNIPGTDIEVTVDIPGLLWANVRGSDWLMVCVDDINKKIVTALFAYCTLQTNLEHCIVVFWNKCTPTASKEMLAFPRPQIEQFTKKEIMILPTDSDIVPVYTLLDAKKTAEVRQQFGDTPLPKILTTDRMQRHYNAAIGSIYMTVSRLGALQPMPAYRVVCPPTN